MKSLKKWFPKEFKEINGIIGGFREGLRSFEVFTSQNKSSATTVSRGAPVISIGPPNKNEGS